MKYLLVSLVSLFISIAAVSQQQAIHYNTPGAGNPIIPGYFADPTVRKIGDTYYIYATTDGNGGGLGPSQVWVSKDFINWTIMPMNWPSTYHIWAPDVMDGKDGKYYMYYCEPCKIYCGVSETPRGPWSNILGADTAVLVPDRFVTNAITLDAQHFIDDDGSVYLYWGTWGIYKGFGCGAGQLSDDLKSFTQTRLIPNTEATDFFEAPFVIKKDGIYYFTYSSGSCHDHTYRVQYATSTEGPLGPYKFADNNPILETSTDSTIHGPGHHSILKEGDDYYIVYHRHNIPGSTRGMHRQIAVDKLVFTDGRIEKVAAGHEGVGALQPLVNPYPNLAFGKKVAVSSFYNDWFKPEYAVDDNNATLWRPRTCGEEWVEIDLEKPEQIERILTQFEYATSYYQYIIETSLDGRHWQTYSDRRNNTLAGSPMVDYGNTIARYIRLTFTGTEKNGLSSALWNIKVFGGSKNDPPQQLVHLFPASWSAEQKQWTNSNGMLSHSMKLVKGEISRETISGKDAVVLQPGTELLSDFILPAPLLAGNEYTLSYQQYVDGVWQTVVLSPKEKNTTVSLDKRLRKLKISAGKNKLYLAGLRLYNWKQASAEIRYDAEADIKITSPAPTTKKGLITSFSANDYAVDTEVTAIKNRTGAEGSYLPVDTLVTVELKNGWKAFRFDGTQVYRSDFSLPATMKDNASYTMVAWVLNSEASEFECVADLTSSHGELEKVMLGYGTSERSGLICHYGWYEDMGLPAFTGSEEWLHIAVTYDGHVEKLYLNGQLVKEKDIVLRLQDSEYVTLGRNAEDEWRFTGWLHSLEFYDTPADADTIREMYLK